MFWREDGEQTKVRTEDGNEAERNAITVFWEQSGKFDGKMRIMAHKNGNSAGNTDENDGIMSPLLKTARPIVRADAPKSSDMGCFGMLIGIGLLVATILIWAAFAWWANPEFHLPPNPSAPRPI